MSVVVLQHSIFEYSKRVFEGHLDKHPKYSFPETMQQALDDITDLRPSVYNIQIHHHGSESAVVVEGSNLLFCYQVLFRGQKVSIPASDVSRSSIQFNVLAIPSIPQSVSIAKEEVSFSNYFKSKPIWEKVDVLEKVTQTAYR